MAWTGCISSCFYEEIVCDIESQRIPLTTIRSTDFLLQLFQGVLFEPISKCIGLSETDNVNITISGGEDNNV